MNRTIPIVLLLVVSAITPFLPSATTTLGPGTHTITWPTQCVTTDAEGNVIITVCETFEGTTTTYPGWVTVVTVTVETGMTTAEATVAVALLILFALVAIALLKAWGKKAPESPATVVQTPSTKFCRKCGTRIPRDSAYCEECGTPQVIMNENSPRDS